VDYVSTGTIAVTIFEYLMVLVSIILGLGVTQVLRGLSRLARSDSTYGALAIWAVFLFYMHIQVWWALWDLHAVPDWNQAFFILLVLIPCSLFGATELLLPMGATPETDWRAHFFEVRRWFFAMMIVMMSFAVVESRVFLGTPLTHPYRIVQALVITALIIGFVSGKPRVQPWLAVSALGVVLAGQVLFRLVPGLN